MHEIVVLWYPVVHLESLLRSYDKYRRIMYNSQDDSHSQNRSILERGTPVMPRIRQFATQYANEDFIKELRKKMIDYNYGSVKELAQTMPVDPRTMYRRVENPEKFTVSDFRKIIPLLHPDLGIVLTLLGYTKQDIKRFKEK